MYTFFKPAYIIELPVPIGDQSQRDVQDNTFSQCVSSSYPKTETSLGLLSRSHICKHTIALNKMYHMSKKRKKLLNSPTERKLLKHTCKKRVETETHTSSFVHKSGGDRGFKQKINKAN